VLLGLAGEFAILAKKGVSQYRGTSPIRKGPPF